MAEHGSAPGRATEGTQNNFATANDTTSGYEATNDARPRCARRGHPLTAHRSVALNHGPQCWRRVDVGRLDLARAEAGRRLAALARRVSRADMDELDRIGRALDLVGGAL